MTLSIHRYHAKVCRRLQLVMPTGADPISYIAVATRPRMRLSVKKDARGLPMLPSCTGNPAERRGGTCSFTFGYQRICRGRIDTECRARFYGVPLKGGWVTLKFSNL